MCFFKKNPTNTAIFRRISIKEKRATPLGAALFFIYRSIIESYSTRIIFFVAVKSPDFSV